MKPRVVAIIQARMGSSRLPGKVLLDIAGQPMLGRVLARSSRAATLDGVMVATTTEAADDPVAGYCDSRGIPVSRGSLHDVLDRYYQAALQTKADVVLRVTGDCPVIDPALLDEVVNTLLQGSFDFACDRLPPPLHRTYPVGLDAEACTFAALRRAWQEAREPHQREHVMPYLYEGVELSAVNDRLEAGVSPRGNKIALLHCEQNYSHLRWTVDTAADLEFMRQVYLRFGGRDDFSWRDLIALLAREPELSMINASVKHKTFYDVDQQPN